MLIISLIILLFPVCHGAEYYQTDNLEKGIALCMSKGLTLCRFDVYSKDKITCIKKEQICDGKSNCLGGEDELYCLESTIKRRVKSCGADRVRCLDGRCASVCNGVSECKYGEDESSCTICNEDEISCMKYYGTSGCARLCDGISECKGNLDEINCVSSSCSAHDIICKDGNCASLCNNCTECRTHEDEIDCISDDVEVIENVCPFGHIGCSNNVTYNLCDFFEAVANKFNVPFISRSQCLQVLRKKCTLYNYILYSGLFT